MNYFLFLVSNLINKKVIRILLFSLTFLSVPIAPSEACLGYASYHSESILLNKPPKKLHGATFMGKVKLVRVTNIDGKTIVRAIVQESETHPGFVGKKMMFISNPMWNFCGGYPDIPVSVGSQGFAIGRALKLGSKILYVKPYKISEQGVFNINILTENASIPLSKFY